MIFYLKFTLQESLIPLETDTEKKKENKTLHYLCNTQHLLCIIIFKEY